MYSADAAMLHLLKILKLPSGYVYKVYMKFKCILCLDLGPIPKLSHLIAKKKWKILKSETLLDKGYSTCTVGQWNVFFLRGGATTSGIFKIWMMDAMSLVLYDLFYARMHANTHMRARSCAHEHTDWATGVLTPLNPLQVYTHKGMHVHAYTHTFLSHIA